MDAREKGGIGEEIKQRNTYTWRYSSGDKHEKTKMGYAMVRLEPPKETCALNVCSADNVALPKQYNYEVQQQSSTQASPIFTFFHRRREQDETLMNGGGEGGDGKSREFLSEKETEGGA